jgi:hypothetical protein
MSQEVIEITEREIEVIEVVERGPSGPTGPQANINYTVVSSPQTLTNSQNIAADTSGGTFTLTLPASPNEGDSIDIFDYSETFDTNPLVIARNGERIESLEEDLIANVEGAYFTMIYTGSTRGWQILPRYGTAGNGGGESTLTNEGDMLYRGSLVNQRLPIGSAGQILKVNSTSNAPEWGAPPTSPNPSNATPTTVGGASAVVGTSTDYSRADHKHGLAIADINATNLRSHLNVADGANNYTHPNHSGDVTSVGDGATTIANDAVTNVKLANVAASTLKGRISSGTGDPEDLSASDVRTILNVADGAEANVQSNWTEADSGSDAFILNKPSTFTPSLHGSTHHTGGTDVILPENIGAQSLLITENLTLTGSVTLTAARAKLYQVIATTGTGKFIITLPTTGNQVGDIVVLERLFIPNEDITIETSSEEVFYDPALNPKNRKLRYFWTGAVWESDRVIYHEHVATAITDGTLDIARLPVGTTENTVAAGDDSRFSDIPDPSSATPQALGTAAAGTSDDYSRGDHVHAAPALDDLSNVSAATPSDNDVLTFDTATSTWVAEAAAGGGSTTQTDIFTANDTWTKPAGAKLVHYLLIGGGGGGGAGRRGATSTTRFGGAGGGGAGLVIGWQDADRFDATESVTVGSSGAGGADSANDTDGAAGANGGATTFNIFTAVGGNGGNGGTTALATGGAGTSFGLQLSGSEATTATGGNSAAVGGNALPFGPTGGGGGASISNTNSASNTQGTGGTQGRTGINRTDGGPVSGDRTGNTGNYYAGTGGGGNRATAVTFAGNRGGDGGLYGAGGGGGSGSLNDAGGDNGGGDGAQGIVVITTYF